MDKAFDYIAMPKGQTPGGPVQASDGRWYLVLDAMLDLDQALDCIVALRQGRPVTSTETVAALSRLGDNLAKKA
ncbi:hypothetical protein [uncultured Pelagibacterium sp.]|uniref:hypothetical protein n=1 Tax=uncultured Pelagibacterium sp. TaxID=1159875 RepID=UPI0030D6F6F7